MTSFGALGHGSLTELFRPSRRQAYCPLRGSRTKVSRRDQQLPDISPGICYQDECYASLCFVESMGYRRILSHAVDEELRSLLNRQDLNRIL